MSQIYLNLNSLQFGIKSNYKSIIIDPRSNLYNLTYPLSLINNSKLIINKTFNLNSIAQNEQINASLSRFNKFKKILLTSNSIIDLNNLKKLSWNGIPMEFRSISWQLLLNYLPSNNDRRASTLKRKRKEYLDSINQLFNNSNDGPIKDQTTWHQISIDVPRTNPHLKLYSYPIIQKSLERILYLWAVRHPASGYVQGINDLSTPFFQVFLSNYLNLDNNKNSLDNFDPSNVNQDILNAVEADTFWCLTKLLDSIQDNYIHAQPGIIRQVNELKDLIYRIDIELANHLEKEGIEFLQFSFRWMNCLLMRELSIDNIIRMWDTYLTEGINGFSEFHIYVCAAFLVKWSDELKQMEFQDIMIFLQNPPTTNWTEEDVGVLLSEAYVWQSLYKNASAHLKSHS
ncbi:GTPase-activating protein GYP1 [Ascoidea rubescens DSM 1968]|uniref:RabGAP/TBC n=1 Tax=Ascoidea rubescens DSM 1968 TaxID=1344418 RepID=A0A1D2VDF0_9ASCO|nr:RabGAP/TBC [Ascoidea rubescens DSM 1968]ODV59487.1 RabGAP/TBC [Ascoidea rubescens DSM 1968]